MFRSAVSKVMWVGRATVFLVGLVVVVGVTVGLGSTAVAQAQNQPGQQGVFRLAVANTTNALSSLVGSVADNAMLLVDNNGGGPALDLKVEPGQAPMKVDSGAKVDNLNADKVDGLDSEQLRGQTGAQGERGRQGERGPQGIQGATGATGPQGVPGVSGYEVALGESASANAGGRATSTAICAEGKRVIGGGFDAAGSGHDVYSNRPVVNDGLHKWEAQIGGGQNALAVTAYAICADAN